MSDIILSNASFDVKSKTLIIGKQGENVSRSFVFDFSAWESAFGEGTLTLFVKRHSDSAAYPVLLSIAGNRATWNVSDIDTAKAGTGALEIRYAVDGVVVKSETFNSYVYPSITATDDPAPDPYESWIETLVTLGETTQINAQRAEAAAQTYPYIDSVSKHWMVWDVEAGEYVDTGISAEGQGGGGGSDGIWLPNVDADGVISWQKSESTTPPTVRNIKGAKGDKGAQGERGEKGEQGEQGIQGERGADGAKGDKGDKGDRGEQGVKGDKGDKGDTGVDGHTPVRGTDYWTAADQQQIVADVLSALPAYEGGSY